MRIISQNSNRSFNFDKIEIFLSESNICVDKGAKVFVLGNYATSERAIEVFNDIHKAYASSKSKNVFIPCHVYRMPEN